MIGDGGTLAPLALLVGGGAVAWRWLGGGCGSTIRRALWSLAMAPAIGFGAPALLVVAFACGDLALPRPWIWGALLFTLFLALALLGGRARAVAAPSPPSSPEPRWLTAAALLVLVLVATFSGPTIAAGLKSWPAGTWDAVAIWNARAMLLFRAADAADTALARTDEDAHPDYPLLVSAGVAASWGLLGQPLDSAAATVSLAWFAATLLLTGLALSAPGKSASGLLAAALLLATPPFVKWASAQTADVVVAYGLLLAALAFAGRETRYNWPSDRLPAGLFGLAIGLLAGAKTEGTVIAAAVFAGAWVVRVGLGRRRSKGFAADLFLLAPFATALLAQRLLLPAGHRVPAFFVGDWLARIVDPVRQSAIFDGIVERFAGGPTPHGWGLFWPLVIALSLLALTQPRDRSVRTPALFGIVASASIVLAAFLLTAIDFRAHLDSTLDRLLLQITPLALVLAASPLAVRSDARGFEWRRSPLLRWVERLCAALRAQPILYGAGAIAAFATVKLLAIRDLLGAMWRWPEELVVATTSFATLTGLAANRGAQLVVPNLTSALLVPVELFGLEGPFRYRALLAALNVGLALLLLSALLAGRRAASAILWATLGLFAGSGWILLRDGFAGVLFLLLLVLLERVARAADSRSRWWGAAAAALSVIAADPTLALPVVLGVSTFFWLVHPRRGSPALASAWLAVLAPTALAGWTALQRAPADAIPGYLDLAASAPLRLFAARGAAGLADFGAALARELAYLNLATLGWLAGGIVALSAWRRRKAVDPAVRTLLTVAILAVVARAVCAAAGMALTGSPERPRDHLYGRPMDFAIPAGLWLGARLLGAVRAERSRARAVIVALVGGGGAALLFATLPDGYAATSTQHQLVPFQAAMNLLLQSTLVGDFAPWVVIAMLALSAWLATAPIRAPSRAATRFTAAALAVVLLLGNGVAILGQVAFESTGSELYHSQAVAEVGRTRERGDFVALLVDQDFRGAPGRDAASTLAWKDALRVVADLPRLALAEEAPPGLCPAVLTSRGLSGRPLLASLYDGELRLWGARSGADCEGPAPRPAR